MYVLADLEWAFTRNNEPYPTQIAFLRVDESWRTVDSFYSRVAPVRFDPNWLFCAFNGGDSYEFREAGSWRTVSDKLHRWLCPDDILCWWFAGVHRAFRNLFSREHNRRRAILSPYMPEFLVNPSIAGESPYKLLRQFMGGVGPVSLPGPEHHALRDVETIQMLFTLIQFPQLRLTMEVKQKPRPSKTQSAVPAPIPGSPIFRKEIPLPREKQLAVDRFKQARRDRDDADWESITPAQRKDFAVLTDPKYAFWAAHGYQTFHTHDCPKLRELSHLSGFARYDQAIRAGYTPCKHCEPTDRQNVVYSIPINNRERLGESYRDLERLCEEQGYPFNMDAHGGWFYLRTPVGKWRINLSARPITLEHVNLSRPEWRNLYYHK